MKSCCFPGRKDLSALIYCLAFVGGFVIMSLELLGGRVMAPWFGSSIYVWGSIITVFMASLAIGYLLGGRWSLNSPSLNRFGSLFLGGALLLYPLVYFSEPAMVWIFARIEDPRYGSLAASCLLFVLPTVMLGMISPYSVRLLVKNTEESGNIAGRLYFVSTFGSTLGTLGTSFYFVLWFEIDTILNLLTASLALVGIVAIAFGARRR
ncbi:MAG: fused MFS/spermidine synthase [Gammaproteobacteria bacterium]|nr:fused MFS/spermidine synthase [Gammaproteobacteria bacterium]MDE0367171.1 fused MFS/spermidine synthase [Gammaproteobacteria bacterium]